MKRLGVIFAAALYILVLMASPIFAGSSCLTIQDRALFNSAGELITPGYDQWGYNYGSKLFNGGYCDSYRNAAWCQAYADVDLIMKWNDAWLSNKDCDGDRLLDRHYGWATYRGSGAWLTNHQSGKVEVNGKMRQWTYFCKIVAVPLDAVKNGGYWYTAGGTQIGVVIWGDFAVTEEVVNDPSMGQHGIQYKSPAAPGLGLYQP